MAHNQRSGVCNAIIARVSNAMSSVLARYQRMKSNIMKNIWRIAQRIRAHNAYAARKILSAPHHRVLPA